MSTMQKSFRAGQIIFRENDPADQLYIIAKGVVAIRKLKGEGYVEFARLYSKEVLGELGFFDRGTRSASAVALTDVELLCVPFDGLDRIYSTVPEYMKTIFSCIARRLRSADEIILSLKEAVAAEHAGGAEGVPVDDVEKILASDSFTSKTKPK